MAISDNNLSLKQGSVVVVPFPYADRLAEKHRPAIVVSSSALHDRRIVWLAMVTSAENAGWICDIPIAPEGQTGLSVASVIRPWKLATVDLARVIRIAGKISEPERQALIASVESALR